MNHIVYILYSINIKNRYIDGQIVPPFFGGKFSFFAEFATKELIIGHPKKIPLSFVTE